MLTRFYREFLLAQKPGRRALPAHASSSATTSCGSPGTRCPTRRSSTCCTSTCRSATATARWCARRRTSCARRSRRAAATSASRRQPPQTFYMRKRFIQSHSRWSTTSSPRASTSATDTSSGAFPPRRSSVEPTPCRPVPTARPEAPTRPAAQPLRLLRPVHSLQGSGRAARGDGILGEDFDGHLWIHGANLETPAQGVPRAVQGAARAVPSTVTFAGPYDHDRELDS